MYKRNLALVPVLVLLFACESLGLPSANTFENRIGVAYATQTAVLDATTQALAVGEISSAEAESVAKISDNLKTLLNAARTVHATGDTDSADRTLRMATTLLEELQKYLRSRQS